jgi:hypothetical protein
MISGATVQYWNVRSIKSPTRFGRPILVDTEDDLEGFVVNRMEFPGWTRRGGKYFIYLPWKGLISQRFDFIPCISQDLMNLFRAF